MVHLLCYICDAEADRGRVARRAHALRRTLRAWCSKLDEIAKLAMGLAGRFTGKGWGICRRWADGRALVNGRFDGWAAGPLGGRTSRFMRGRASGDLARGQVWPGDLAGRFALQHTPGGATHTLTPAAFVWHRRWP